MSQIGEIFDETLENTTYDNQASGGGKLPQATIKRKKWDKKKTFYYSLMAFPLLQFCIFYIGVNFQSILLSMQTYQQGEFLFADDLMVNFKKVISYFTEYDTLTVALKNSVLLWFFTAICGTLLAVFFSYYVFKRKKIGRFFRLILFLPSILPAVLLSTVFKLFTGDITTLAFGWEPLITTEDQSLRLATIIFYCIWVGFGTQVLLYSNAMEQVSPSVLEAADLDGVTPMRELFSIVVPQIMPTISTFMIATIAGMFINQANLYNFYGADAGNKTITLGYYMFVIVQDQHRIYGYGQSMYPFASALGLCCTAVAIPLTVLFRKFSKRYED